MDQIKQFAKLLWWTGGVLCIMVFVYQATPILLHSLDASWLEPAGMFLIFFALCVLVICTILLFSWLSEELKDRKHYLATRRRMRTQRQPPPQGPQNSHSKIRRFPNRP